MKTVALNLRVAEEDKAGVETKRRTLRLASEAEVVRYLLDFWDIFCLVVDASVTGYEVKFRETFQGKEAALRVLADFLRRNPTLFLDKREVIFELERQLDEAA